MKHILIALFITLLAGPAFAAADKIEAEALPPELVGKKIPVVTDEIAEPVTAEQQAALICQSAEMMGQKLQGAEYVPGVDAYGNKVADADVYNAMPFEVPDQIEVPINMDVMAALGVTAPPLEGKGAVGKLVINKGGTLTFNDRDITNNIQTYCTEHLKKMKAQEKAKQ